MIAAIVPAAGKSARMGRPKLTLPVSGGGTVIDRVIAALRVGGAETILVIGPPIDAPGASELFERARAAADFAIPVPWPTSDMRATVELGLDFLDRARIHPTTILIAPGDSVGLTPALVAAVVARVQVDSEAIVIPRHGGRRGHPLALPSDVAQSIRTLPPDVGINAIRDRFADRVVLLDVSEPGTTLDLDTPADYLPWAPSG